MFRLTWPEELPIPIFIMNTETKTHNVRKMTVKSNIWNSDECVAYPCDDDGVQSSEIWEIILKLKI